MAYKLASYIAEQRFGYGPKAGIVTQSDPEQWLLWQLKNYKTPQEFSDLPPTRDLAQKVKEFSEQRSMLKKSGNTDKSSLQKTRREFIKEYMDEVDARLKVISYTDTPFYERLCWFWANHFAVSGVKAKVAPVLGSYEREAIRPNINGHFYDLLKNVVQHPAMIFYLDNQNSVDPSTKGSVRKMLGKKKSRGINENLAREIMELHTLGVDGGYTQTDVTNFAHVITGWTVRENSGNWFQFIPGIHDPNPQQILGRVYNQQGISQGEAVLKDLSLHPATAHHISFKLAKHFVADDPPKEVVDRLTNIFKSTGGHLPSVYEALVKSPEVWQKPFTKAKNHIEYVASVKRLFPDFDINTKNILPTLDSMGQKPWFPVSPQGWPDTSADWLTPDAIWKRIEMANIYSRRIGNKKDARELASSIYGPSLSDTTKTSIARAESGEQAIALLLLSPEFQRR